MIRYKGGSCLWPSLFGGSGGGAFVPSFDRTAEELDMQQRATGWNQTWGHCGEDTASVHGVPTRPTEPQGHPMSCILISALQSHDVTISGI